MATVASIIESARWDLRDEEDTQYTDAMLLDFGNRGLRPLSVVLAMVNSDWVNESADLTLALGDSEVSLPSNFVSDITVRTSTSYLDKKSVSAIRRLLVDSTPGQPDKYAIRNTIIMFEKVASVEYTIVLEYNKHEDALVSDGDMPYNDEFNDILRQFIVLVAKSRNEYELLGDAAMQDFFYAALFSKSVARNYISNSPYRTDY